MIEKEAIERYEKQTWKKMQKFMDGNTVGVTEKGELDYYDWDLELAFRASKGNKLSRVDWD